MSVVIARIIGLFAVGSLVLAAACGDDDAEVGDSNDAGGRGTEQTGQQCTAPSQCYPGVDGGTVVGDVKCLDRVPNGYCTHTCTKDEDCCAVPGECLTGVKQVCSPFESTGQMMCFLSCEDADIDRAIASNSDGGYYDGGVTDAGSREDAYCQSFATAYASCRSSGGGNKNRKVCIPKQ